VHTVHRMRQVHGAEVGIVDATTPVGAEVRDVDALVTGETGRALAVQVADCVPALIAAPGHAVAAVHAGREGIGAGVVGSALDVLARLAGTTDLVAAIGPAIGPCCYEVPRELRDRVAETRPDAAATTTWGTPSLDLPGSVRRELDAAGVEVRGDWPGCTRCDAGGRWFSHRADPEAGRQIGMIVRLGPEEAEAP
ncbi:MAG: polyphenol oxidase family protein, partial [Nitriliruptorales bacterium]